MPYQSQITVDMLNTAPIPKQWINEDSMSLISQTMGVVEPDGHSYYYYEYKIQNESFLMVKKADTGETIMNGRFDYHIKRINPYQPFYK